MQLGRGVQVGTPSLFVALGQWKQSCESVTLNLNSSQRNAVGHSNAAFVPKSRLESHD